MSTRTPQPGEKWTPTTGNVPWTFVGLHPDDPEAGVWVAGGSLIAAHLSSMVPPDPFPFKAGDLIQPVGVTYAIWRVKDPCPDDERNFHADYISSINDGEITVEFTPNVNKMADWVMVP